MISKGIQPDLPIRPNPDGRKNAKPNGRKSDETAEKMRNRTAEYDETAEYGLAAIPTYYIKAIFHSCHANFLLYFLHIISTPILTLCLNKIAKPYSAIFV